MELFTKLVYGCKPLTILAKNDVLDVWSGPKYFYAFSIYFFI